MKNNPYGRAYIIIAVISVLMMLVVLNLPIKAKPFGDFVFHEETKKVALFVKGDLPADQVTVTWAPGPILFFAVPYILAPSDASDDTFWTYGVTWTGIFITLAMLLIFRTATQFFGKSVATLSILLFFIFPTHYYYSLGISGEAPAFFAMALLLYGWSRSWNLPAEWKGWAIMGSGFLLLILNRPNVMLFFGFVALVLLYTWFRNRPFFDTYARPMIITFAAVFIAGFGILKAASNLAPGAESPQEGLFYYVAHQGRFQFREEPTDFRYWDNLKRGDSKDYQNWVRSTDSLHRVVDSGQKYTAVYRNFVINDVMEHPMYVVQQFFVKAFYGHVFNINSVDPATFSMGPLKGPWGFSVLITAINLVNIMLIAGLFLFVFRSSSHLPYWPFYTAILSLVVFHSLMYMEPRYLFPSKPALYVLAAAGLYRFAWVRRGTDLLTGYLMPKTQPR